MSSPYHERTDEGRAEYWRHVVIGKGVLTNNPLNQLHQWIGQQVYDAYMQGVKDGKATERGERLEVPND